MLLLAVIICATFLLRSGKDIYSVTHFQDDFLKRYLTEYTGDSTQPQEYVNEADGKVAVYVLREGAINLKANKYDLGLQYAAQTEGSVLKVFSSDYVSADNSGGKILFQQTLDPTSTYLKATFELDQDVHSVYIFVETTDESFALERMLLESWTPVCTDRYFYCAATLVAAAFVMVLMNWKHPQVKPASLGQFSTTSGKTMQAFVFIMFAAVFAASIPLVQDALFAGHDMPFHLARIEGMASSLCSGQFPVRVHGETLNGYGYANSLFYPELLLYFPALLSVLGVSTVTCYKFYIVFINILTVALGYFAFKKLFNSRYTALALAVIYLLNPYRLICAYYRNALGEFAALTFLPLVVYGLYAVLLGNQKDWPWLVAGASGLLQTHILTTELAALFSAVIVLVFVRQLFTKEKRFLSLIYAGVGVVLLNAWFIIPMLLMIISLHPMVFTRVQNPMGFAIYDISNWFNTTVVTPIGPHPVGWVILFGIVGYLLYRVWICAAQGYSPKQRFADCMVVVAIVSIIATTSYFPWEGVLSIPILGGMLDAIQFPYRLMSLVAVCGTIIVGYTVLAWLKERKQQVIAFVCAMGVSVFCICLLYESAFGPEVEKYESKHYYVSNMNNSLCVGQYEYLPTGSDLNKMVEHSPQITSENESLSVQNWTRYGTNMSFDYTITLTQTEQDTIRLPLTYIPGYEVRVNGQPVGVQTADGYVVSFVPPAESGTVTVRYSEPMLFRLSELVSVAAFIGLCVGVPLYRRKKLQKM